MMSNHNTAGVAGAEVHARAAHYAADHGCGFHEAVAAILAEDEALAVAYELDRQRFGKQRPRRE